MTKLTVSYPPMPPRERRERLTAKAQRLVWSLICWSVALSAAVAALAALGR